MKIVFFGDSITDAGRNKEKDKSIEGYGYGYVHMIASVLNGRYPQMYEVVNKGVNGDKIVDLYARLKSNVWNLKPDMLSILRRSSI